MLDANIYSILCCSENAHASHQNSSRPISVDSSERTPLLASTSDSMSAPDVEVKVKQKEPSLVKVLAKCYGFTMFQAHLCKLVTDILTFVGPQLQR